MQKRLKLVLCDCVEALATRTDLLDCDDLLRFIVHALVYGAKAAGAELLQDCVLTGGVIVGRHREGGGWWRLSKVPCLVVVRGLGRGRRRTSEDAGL